MPRRDKEKQLAFQRDHYRRNGDRVREKVTERKRLIKGWFRDYKTHLACTQCRENHPACLHFHHRDPNQKDFNVSEMVRSGWGIDRILEEVSKCEILCANCHAKLHWDD